MGERKQTSQWSPEQYLKFSDERTQPAVDLAARIEMVNPLRIIDIGCGTGTSTAVLKNRWPNAHITGIDNSTAMLEKAKADDKDIDWINYDISTDLSPLGKFDIVFSNAVLQWVSDLEAVIPRLFGLLRQGGALAIQIPYTEELPFHLEREKLAASENWNGYLGTLTNQAVYHPHTYFYEIMSSLTDLLFLWQTDYIQIMQSQEDIVEWNKGSSLRPFLDALPNDTLKNAFLKEYAAALHKVYKTEKNGTSLFPFTRIFLIAYAR